MTTEPVEPPEPTRRERQRQATVDEIVAVSRGLLKEPGGLSLRAVAQQMGMTAPALYRYVASYQDLVYLVADDIDTDVASVLGGSRDGYPDDDPAAQIIAAAIAFRHWALTRSEEFALVFANPMTAKSLEQRDEISGSMTAEFFSALLEKVWAKYQFAVPSVDALDPDVVTALREPYSPAIPCAFPDEVLGLGWVFMRSWVSLYGIVALEVFGHLDPNIIASGAMFRTMLDEQAHALGFADELPRLRRLVAEEMRR